MVGYNGYIDELAITLKAKTPSDLTWDANIYCFNPFEGIWQNDRGPHEVPVSTFDIVPEFGRRGNAINFNRSNSSIEINSTGFIGYPNQNFTTVLFARQDVPGIFLIIAYKKTCLL